MLNRATACMAIWEFVPSTSASILPSPASEGPAAPKPLLSCSGYRTSVLSHEPAALLRWEGNYNQRTHLEITPP